tara:strand:+ start:887 stop:1753 length:867 start_codon:yes stop_codon:yes gene_type:complete
MNDNQKLDQINNPSKVYALFYSFFLIPLMITIFGVLFFFLFKMLTYEKQDPYHLLNNIKSGSLTKRWQSAYELSNLMTDPSKIPDDALFVNQIITMYEKSIHDDSRVRTYLALAMGQTENILFGDVLMNGLNDSDLENRIAAIKSLGSIKYIKSVSQLNNIVTSENSQQERLAAIISLGQIKDKSSIRVLIESLDDEEANIRWDAAISLYKMDNNSGIKIVKNLLNRRYYTNYPNVDNNEISNTILTVLALISDKYEESFKDELIILSQKEENIKIREFSMKILAEHY